MDSHPPEKLLQPHSSIQLVTTELNMNPSSNFSKSAHSNQQQLSLNFEEIKSQNMKHYSNAISSAFAKSLNRDFSSAIQILESAIGFLKKSELSNDDHSQILISSLQDMHSNIAAVSNNLYAKTLKRK